MMQKLKAKLKTILWWTPLILLITIMIKLGIIDTIHQDGVFAISFNYGMF